MRRLTITALFIIMASGANAQNLVIRAEKIYTMAGETITNGVIVIKDGKIERIGPNTSVPGISGVETLQARVVTPGLVDAHTVVGLSGYLNQDHDQDQLEKSSAIQPELRAIDAYNAREPLVAWIRSFGVTTIHTGHGPGALISGQTMIVKTRGGTIDEAVVKPQMMLAMTLGPSAYGKDRKNPGTRAKEMAMLREQFIKADAYRKKRAKADDEKKPARDLSLEALVGALEGKTPVLITVHRTQDIMSALRLADEFGLKLVLDGAAESYELIDEIKKAGVPVLIHPMMARPFGEKENISYETAAKLRRAGIPVALQSGYEGYVPKTRVVLFEAAIAAANGLSFEEALGTITIDAAKILGIDDRVGSLEQGKDADLVLFDGDPFEYTTHVTAVVIDGKVVSDTVR